jgi:hypothetical protein
MDFFSERVPALENGRHLFASGVCRNGGDSRQGTFPTGVRYRAIDAGKQQDGQTGRKIHTGSHQKYIQAVLE